MGSEFEELMERSFAELWADMRAAERQRGGTCWQREPRLSMMHKLRSWEDGQFDADLLFQGVDVECLWRIVRAPPEMHCVAFLGHEHYRSVVDYLRSTCFKIKPAETSDGVQYAVVQQSMQPTQDMDDSDETALLDAAVLEELIAQL